MKTSSMVGEMRLRGTIERRARGDDSSGGRVHPDDWVRVADTYCAVRPLSGREYFQAQAVQSVISHMVTIRWQPDIGSDCRIVVAGRRFEVRSSMDPDQRRRFLRLMCEEVP